MFCPRFLIIALSAAALTAGSALATTRSTDHPGSLPVLLGVERVRKELGLTASQCSRIDVLRSGFREEARKIVAAAPADPAGRKEALAALEKATADFNQRALAVLTPAQSGQLARIEHKVLGGTMLVAPSVQEKLKMTPAQKTSIESLRTKGLDFVDKTNKRFESGQISFKERIALLREYRSGQSAAMLKVLNPSQKAALDTLRTGNPTVLTPTP